MNIVSNKINNPTLCLNMIVKNESKIITRLFDSVLSIIDTYCICDTGSTDNTIQVIQNYFKDKNIKGKIIEAPFVNFSHNRNIALQACFGLSDYILFLDADMVVQINNFDKKYLFDSNCFTVFQGNESFFYQNLRIIKNDGLSKYIGVTHEYIDIPSDYTIFDIDKNQLFINDLGDGGSKKNKFQRDIQLLLNGLKEEPENLRYHFYLANSYYDSENYLFAINSYKKRIELGGWKEEIWYSYYRIGLCYNNMGMFNNALSYWLDAYDYYPERIEGIYEIIKFYRINKKYKLCMDFYLICKKIINENYNKDLYLFLHNDIYTYKIFYEYTIFAAYNDIKNISDEVILILNNCNDNLQLNSLIFNLKFYKFILKSELTYDITSNITTYINGININFNSSSSCLIKKPNKNGYFCNIRYVNYIIEEDGNYLIQGDNNLNNFEKNTISVNKFVEFDTNFNIIREEWMDLLFDNRLYIGIEDVKIFYDNKINSFKYIGTGFHSNDTIGIVSSNYDLINKKFEINELKQNFKISSCEKNWVFVDYNHETHIIYDWYPLKICKNINNELKIVEKKDMPKIFKYVRGSSCGFSYIKDMISEIWFVNHIVSADTPRHYYHLISVFDINMNLLRYSAPFIFEGEPIEYCLSIIVDNEKIIINYSTWDRTTKISIYNKEYIESLLKY